MNSFNEILGKAAGFMQQNKIIQSISHALMSLMPALMIGAIGSMIQQIPFAGYQAFLQSSGIYALTQTFVNVSTNMLALYASFAIAYQYAKTEGFDGFTAGCISMISFLVITPMETVGEGWAAVTNLPLSWLGSRGLFAAIIISIISAKVYCLFVKNNITIKMPDSVPPFISKSFGAIIPAAVIAVCFGLLSLLIKATPFGDVHSLIYGLIGAPLSKIGGSIWAALLIYVLSGLCWFFGIHGIAVVSAVMPIWMGADAANISAVSAGLQSPNIVTYNWLNAIGNIGGAGCTLGLILLCTFTAKSKRYREIGKLAIVPSLFGINEPVVFGLPCMLNPVLAIPFIFTPVLLIAVSYILTIIGILPVGNGVGAPAAIPVLSGMFNGGWRMAVWNVIEIVIITFIYLPFFRKLDAEALKEESGE